jgi:hypothetical protein
MKMSDSTIGLKPVSALLTGKDGQPANYWIRAYQRGYRWTPLQVTQLLNDIWDFIQESEGGARSQFYCLQPLVVKLLPDGVIEVVDGQQRLTTIHIILTCLKPMASMLTSTFFRLTFETRDDVNRPSLDPVDLSREMENIDYHHICQAYRAVQKWCEGHSPQQQLKLLQHLLNDDASGRNVKVIWFELGDNDNAVDAFTRLNVGKIRLTNDELIRALFLGRGRQGQAADETVKVRIAYEWDIIEKELQAADFWAFLTDQKREQNRIGFLFELIADRIPPEAVDDEYKVFYSFNQKLGEPGTTLENEWLEIKREFMRLQEWFEDERRIAYHIVGFLVTQSVGLAEIRELSKECTKSQFDRRLRDRVYQSVMGAPAVPPEEELRTRLTAHLDSLEYGRDSKKIRSILLLFNIATLLEHERSNMRFQFDAFKDVTLGWDLEHIRSVASDKITDHTAWLTDCLRFLETQTDDRTLVPAIKAYLAPNNTSATNEQFEVLHLAILRYFGESEEQEERNDLANLTLLDSRTNRSYKNAPFAVKRQKILSLDKSGIFIPLCTRNVFLKCYSEQAGNPIFWTDEDGDAYQHAILETLVGFFLGKEAAQ